jgi:hypothetical protein
MHRILQRSAAALAVAILVGWLAAGVVVAGGHGHHGCAQAQCGPNGCGPQGCPTGGCHRGHGQRCGHCGHCGHGCKHGMCHHGHCGKCSLCGHPVGGPCSYGMSGGIHEHCKSNVWEKRYFLRSQGKAWHSAWYDPAEGRPIALVVPPTAEFQTQYSWGVPSSRVAPIYHQFRRPYPGPGGVAGSGGGGFLPTPNIPSDTVQFGVNAVRGPWGAS